VKLPSIIFGSALVILFGTQIGCSGSDTASTADTEQTGSDEGDLKKANTVKFTDFANEVQSEEDFFAEGDDCSLAIASDSGSMTLTVTEGKTSTQIVVSDRATITLSDKSNGDSSNKTFKVRGIGSINFLHADDAFESVTIVSDATKATSTCEIDF